VKLADGGEVIADLVMPLPMTVAGVVSQAIAEALEGIGYSDVVVDTRAGWRIVATPPGQARSAPPPAEGGAATPQTT
jgi:hypothetical protein